MYWQVECFDRKTGQTIIVDKRLKSRNADTIRGTLELRYRNQGKIFTVREDTGSNAVSR